MITVQELDQIFDMLAHSQVANYGVAMQLQPTVNKLVGVRQAISTGRRLDTLSPEEAKIVDDLRTPPTPPVAPGAI